MSEMPVAARVLRGVWVAAVPAYAVFAAAVWIVAAAAIPLLAAVWVAPYSQARGPT